jgi:hypothetical protein
MCGAESFLVQASSSCGNTYTTMAHDSCGVQSYIRGASIVVKPSGDFL